MARTLLIAMVALPAIPWLFGAATRASSSALGRDQGIFQYVAWAAAHGEKLYRDVRDVNGPLVAMVHLALQGLGGANEHRFRVLDLVFTTASFVFVGVCVPSLGGRDARMLERSAWGAASAAVLLAQYLTYGFWDTAQRESFFDWFLAIAIGAILVAQARPEPDRRALAWLVLAGACSVAPIFGKPTYALFTVAHVLTVLVDREATGRRRRVAALAGGAAISVSAIFAFLLVYADVPAYLRITLGDVPAMYRFIWPRSARAILTMPGYASASAVAIAATFLACGLVAANRLPRRALALAPVPALGLASVLIQAKGFPYHFHPLTFGVGLIGVALVFVASERGPRWLAFALAAFFGVRAAVAARAAVTYATMEQEDAYERVDFFPATLRRTASFVAEHTDPDDRVQTYAMDAYVLFLARRKSATPYIYAYDLNVDAAVRGSLDEDGPHPSPEQTARIRAIRDEHERDMVVRLERAPPAAFVFIDDSPLMSSPDALGDFETHCHDAASFLLSNYVETANSAGMRVWSRGDMR